MDNKQHIENLRSFFTDSALNIDGNLDLKRINEIITTTDQFDLRSAMSFAREASDGIARASDTVHSEAHLTRMSVLSSKMSVCMDTAAAEAMDGSVMKSVFSDLRKNPKSLYLIFMTAVMGKEASAAAKAEARKKEREKSQRLEEKLRGFILNHEERLQHFGSVKHELPALERYVESLGVENKNSVVDLACYVAAAQMMIQTFEENKGELLAELPERKFKKKKDFIEILEKKLTILTQNYAMAVANEVQLARSSDMLVDMRNTLISLTTVEMPYIEKGHREAGKALQLLDMHERLQQYQEHVGQLKENLVKAIAAVKRDPDKIGDLEELQQDFENKTQQMDRLSQSLVAETKALKKSVKGNAITEAQDRANLFEKSKPLAEKDSGESYASPDRVM